MRKDVSAVELDVERKLDVTWPSAADRMIARDVVMTYGSASREREGERVRLAAIKLSNGSLDELRAMIAAAKSDYRDVLMWAEYPEESKVTWSVRSGLSETERRELAAIRARDRAQYDEWRKR